MSLIALEFEENQILVAAARLAGRGCEIQNTFAIPIAGLDEKAVADALKSALAKNSLPRGDAIVVVNRSAVEIRELNVPPAPDNELPDIVRFVAKNEFASLNDNWLLDFVPLGTDPTIPRKVLATGLIPDRHRQITKITEAAGIKTKHIVLRPFATFDLVKPEINDDRGRLIVDLFNDSTDMIVAAGQNVIATRTVRVKSQQSSAGSEGKVNLESAATPTQLSAPDESARRQNLLVGEIKRTLASSRNLLGERSVDEILILGDPDDNQQLASAFGEPAEMEVKFCDILQQLKFDSKTAVPESPGRFAAVCGALIRQVSNAPHTIDFLNPRRPVIQKTDRSRIYLYGSIAAAATMLAILVGWWTLRQQAQEISQLEKKLSETIKDNEGDSNRPSVDQIMGEVSKIDEWKQADINWLQEIYQFSQRFLTPDDAIVDSFDATVRRDQPQIVIRSRMAGIQKEGALLDSLYSRPYEINPPTTGISDEDTSYPMSFDFTVLLIEDRSEIISQIDARALEELKKRNARPAPPVSPTDNDQPMGG